MAAGEWLRKGPRGVWSMDLRQLTVYKHFGWVNMLAITFSFVDQSSSRSLEKFGEDSPTSPEVIGLTCWILGKNLNFCN